MARSGSEKRKRAVTLKARFTEAEAALIKEQADRAGVSVAALIRYAALNQTPLRASRRPPVDRKLAAQLLGQLGGVASALRAANSNHALNSAVIEAAHRDLAELRTVLFEALGREP